MPDFGRLLQLAIAYFWVVLSSDTKLDCTLVALASLSVHVPTCELHDSSVQSTGSPDSIGSDTARGPSRTPGLHKVDPPGTTRMSRRIMLVGHIITTMSWEATSVSWTTEITALPLVVCLY
jgi:hypothetical protein